MFNEGQHRHLVLPGSYYSRKSIVQLPLSENHQSLYGDRKNLPALLIQLMYQILGRNELQF
jgi:hypothetical protein